LAWVTGFASLGLRVAPTKGGPQKGGGVLNKFIPILYNLKTIIWYLSAVRFTGFLAGVSASEVYR
jgi:hypothetical protein